MVCRSGDELAGEVGRVFPFPLKRGDGERIGDVSRALFGGSRVTEDRRLGIGKDEFNRTSNAKRETLKACSVHAQRHPTQR